MIDCSSVFIQMRDDKKKSVKRSFSLKAAIQLAAPHTWPAAFLPVLLGSALAYAGGASVNSWLLLTALATGILLQAAVNTLNDYRDFVNGIDTAANCDDPTDAALIYECDDPRSVKIFGFSLLAAAAVLGAVLVYISGLGMLIYGGLAFLAIALYTLPGVNFSSLPLGELLSGTAMGCVLTCASYHAQAGGCSAETAILSIPAVLTIANIMLANNTSDIERDREGSRRTFPVCVGRGLAQTTLRLIIIITIIMVTLAAFIRFPGGLPIVPVLFIGTALAAYPLFTRPRTPDVRAESMRCILAAHKWTIASYIAVIMLHCITQG